MLIRYGCQRRSCQYDGYKLSCQQFKMLINIVNTNFEKILINSIAVSTRADISDISK